jgi:hypothetical protein
LGLDRWWDPLTTWNGLWKVVEVLPLYQMELFLMVGQLSTWVLESLPCGCRWITLCVFLCSGVIWGWISG